MRTGQRFAWLGFAIFVMTCFGCAGNPPNLHFEDDTASWVTQGNYFAMVSHTETPKWFGLLFQFGKFGEVPFDGKVQFLDDGGNPLTTAPLTSDGWLNASQFTWINIV